MIKKLQCVPIKFLNSQCDQSVTKDGPFDQNGSGLATPIWPRGGRSTTIWPEWGGEPPPRPMRVVRPFQMGQMGWLKPTPSPFFPYLARGILGINI
jgi:hypothetical protein